MKYLDFYFFWKEIIVRCRMIASLGNKAIKHLVEQLGMRKWQKHYLYNLKSFSGQGLIPIRSPD